MGKGDETVNLQMDFVKDMEASFLVSDREGKREWFIPRSLVGYRRKWMDVRGNIDRPMIDFTLPEWKVRQEGLGDYVV